MTQNTREYMREYMRKRYRADPEFRKRLYAHQRKWVLSPKGRKYVKGHVLKYLHKRYHSDPEYRARKLRIAAGVRKRHGDEYNRTRREKYRSARLAAGKSYRPCMKRRR